ncbi:MAG: hypothetical protein ACXWQO_15925 [Bdellovibrionota bacterium]
MRLLALILALLPLSALAEDYALMVNMNYSQKEWAAFKASSEKCGRTPISIPPEELLPLGETVFTMRDALAAKFAVIHPEWKKDTMDNALEEIMRTGSEWQADPTVAHIYAADIANLYKQTRVLNKAELSYGSIAQQFEQTMQAVRNAKGTVSSLAISAHADGWNFTGESANGLSWGDLDEVLQGNPTLARNIQNVLLLGCYNMTENNRPHWNSLFPYASMIAGFGVKAPSRTQPVARTYITENLDTACRLDKLAAKAGQPLDPAYVEAQFKKLPSVTSTSSVIDYCRQIIEGQPGSGNALSCDEQWTTVLAQADAIQDTYLDLHNLKKNPPKFDSASSELRIFYSALQGTCPAAKALQMKGQVEEMENYRRSIRESVIRLIFWWRVQKNFNTYFNNDLAELEQSLADAGIESRIPALDGKTGRVEFVQAYNAIKDEIDGRRSKLMKAKYQKGSSDISRQIQALDKAKEQFAVLRPLFFLQGEHTVSEGAKIDIEDTLARDAIPFNWIEGTVLRPRAQ